MSGPHAERAEKGHVSGYVGRVSPSSSVCYMNLAELNSPARPTSMSLDGEVDYKNKHAGRTAQETPIHVRDESDNTPRSERLSSLDHGPSHVQPHEESAAKPDHGYFSPQPLRVFAPKLPATVSSTDPSPTACGNVLASSVHLPVQKSYDSLQAVALHQEQRSRASATTTRALSTEPIHQRFPSRSSKDGSYYPNQSYAALHNQHYIPPHSPHIFRARSSQPSHTSSHSVTHIHSYGFPTEHRDIMETGSRTVGNSPASSPGLFSPSTPPLRPSQSSDDHGYYSSPYLHHTHRQAPKETHVADVDVDPISGRKIINQYEIIDELGRGVHGKVKLGRNLETGVYVAIKIVDRYSKRRRLGKNGSHEDKIKKEIAILKKARHPHIVSLLEVIDDPTQKKVYIVLEHVELGEVKWRTQGTKEIVVVEYRRYQRERSGITDNQAAALEDDQIIAHAHAKLERQSRRRFRELQSQRRSAPGVSAWSFEHGGESGDEISENGRSSRASLSRPGESFLSSSHQSNMDTAFRSSTPTAGSIHDGSSPAATGLEGTMYGPYDADSYRGRTPSLTGSTSSYLTDLDQFNDVPEHFQYVPLMTMAAARETFRDTVLGLEYLHYQGIIHRDIKPANLLQTREHRIKISDFGVSYLGRQSSDDASGDQSESDFQDADEAIELAKTVGTPAFYAPELCHTDPDADTPPVTGKIDIWALGVTLYCLIFGRVPFHDNNTFRLMKIISDEDVFIPRYRLKAVEEKGNSRPTSHGHMYHSTITDKRSPHDLEYEEIDEELRDLLKRVFIKDPRKRITIKEIKVHPWVLGDIADKSAWVDSTDPSSFSQGRKIEVSKDDVEKAVVPLTLIDRVRSGVRKTLDTVLRIGTRGGSRRRALSTATTPDQPQSLSSVSSSSTVNREARRPSLAINQSIFEALRLSRESEHPLSQSVTASPEASEHSHYLGKTPSRSDSPALSVENSEHPGPLTGSVRPSLSDRAHSTISSAASVRTIRPSDVGGNSQPGSPSIPPALPGTPIVLDTPSGSNLGGLFGGVPRRFVNSMRSRERMKAPKEHIRTKSIDRLVTGDDDPHGGPSIALSNTLAAGHVDQPPILKELSSGGHAASAHDPFDRSISRRSSLSSASSRHRIHSYYEEQQPSEGYPFPHVPQLASVDRLTESRNEFMGTGISEDDRSSAAMHHMVSPRPPSSLSHAARPPSVDEDGDYEHHKLDYNYSQQQSGKRLSGGAGPHHPWSVASLQSRALTSSSSEDHFTSMSQSTSNPSISVVSENSSMVNLGDESSATMKGPCFVTSVEDSADGSLTETIETSREESFADSEFESDSEDSEEEYLTIGGRKNAAPSSARSSSVSNAELSRQSARKEISSSRRRSTRSGSNGTVKKVRDLDEWGTGDSQDELS